MIGKFLPEIVEMSHFIERCNKIAVNTVQQISSLLCKKNPFKLIEKNENDSINLDNNQQNNKNKDKNKDKNKNKNNDEKFSSSFSNVHFFSVFKSLGELFSILQTFDRIINENKFLIKSWNLYKNLTRIPRSDPGSFGTTKVEVDCFESALVLVDSKLFQGNKINP